MSSTTSSSTRKRAEPLRSYPPGPPTHGPYHFPVARRMSATALRSHRCGELTRAHVGQEVRLGGWVHRRRDLGGLVFIDLRDRAGLVQLSCNPAWTSVRGHGARGRGGDRVGGPGDRHGGASPRAIARSVPDLPRGGGPCHRPRGRRAGADAGHSRRAEGEGRAAGGGAATEAPGSRSPPARAAAQPDASPPAAPARPADARRRSSSSRSRRRS